MNIIDVALRDIRDELVSNLVVLKGDEHKEALCTFHLSRDARKAALISYFEEKIQMIEAGFETGF